MSSFTYRSIGMNTEPCSTKVRRIKQGSYRGRSHSKGAISSHGFWKMLITISKAVIQNSR
ncbi:hypothetical protein MUK42_18087 [Musa troglodytarum]|uniref:Uncharacterized protein n=1 Tax=Musa troglodytarum TaxID=320322 RepID=A0A9E7HBZ8_9LILI|nr:hypothetical protein MUK42_18087 [Musa troglodytarum]